MCRVYLAIVGDLSAHSCTYLLYTQPKTDELTDKVMISGGHLLP